MQNRQSNARFLGYIISEPLQIVNGGYTEKETSCKGCMGPCGQCDEGPQEQDPCDLAHDYNAMTEGSDAPTEYDPSL